MKDPEKTAKSPASTEGHVLPPGIPVLTDKYGLELVPQPSASHADPLNFPPWLKYTILLQIAWLGLLGTFNTAIVNAAFVPMSQFYHRSVTVISYQLSAGIAFAGVGAFFWIPLSNVYGRRVVYLVATLLAFASSLGAAYTTTFGALVGTRVVNGFADSCWLTVGGAVVTDLFFLHERGVAMGVFVVFLTQGAHLAAILGGYITEYASFQWAFKVTAIIDAVSFVGLVFLFPETLYPRDRNDEIAEMVAEHGQTPHAIMRRLGLMHRMHGRKLTLADFWRPVYMLKYPAVLLTALTYGIGFSYSSIEPALTVASIFTRLYGWKPGRIGLALGLSTLIGTAIGEVLSGPLSDRILRRARLEHDGKAPAEVRLKTIWPGAFCVPAGLLIYGFTVQYTRGSASSYVPACIGLAVSCMGAQLIASACYSYLADAYRPQMPECSQALNISRQLYGFTLGWYSLALGNAIGYQFAFVIYTGIFLISFLPVVWLMRNGQRVREKSGKPPWGHSPQGVVPHTEEELRHSEL